MSDRDARGAQLAAYHRDQVAGCVRCPLSAGRTQVVIGDGDLDADLMFVGEAPGFHEDAQGVPFVGRAGKLLGTLLEGIGLCREDVYIANVLKCRPPENRDPLPAEIAACEPHLHRQIGLIRPRLVCSLGNFATRLLSGRNVRMGQVHGHELAVRMGDLDTVLYPLYHPAAALYARAMLSVLQEDFARIPQLLAAAPAAAPALDPAPAPAPAAGTAEPAEQLGLF